MLLFKVYDETIEQAQAVAATIKAALHGAPTSSFVAPVMATPEVKQAHGISRYPAIVKDGVLLWEGSRPSEETILQWIEDIHAQRDQVTGAYGRFGYDASNPIPADGNWYCRRLRCPSGHPFWYHRLGSCGTGPDGHIVDHVQLVCFGRESDVFLYFDMYHKGHSSLVPDGLSWEGSPAGRGMTSGRVLDFPKGHDER